MTLLPFAHRMNPDGSIDSICTTCFRTIASEDSEGKLFSHEERHLCDPNWLFDRVPSDARKNTFVRPSLQAALGKTGTRSHDPSPGVDSRNNARRA